MSDRDVREGGALGLLEPAWRARRLVLVLTLLAAAAGFAVSLLQPRLYQAEANLLLADPRTTGVFDGEALPGADPNRYVRNQAQLANSASVAARVSERLGGRMTPRQVRERSEAQPAADRDLLSIQAVDPRPGGAVELADAVAEAYQQLVTEEVQVSAQQSLEELEGTKAQLSARINAAEERLRGNDDDAAAAAERDAAVAQLITIEGRADQIAVDAALYGSGVELFESAALPQDPAQPRPARNALLAGVLGCVGAAVYARWRALHARRADDRHDAARVLGAPLLGEIPDFATVGVVEPDPARSAPHSRPAEAYEFIASSLDFVLAETGASTVLITSAQPADGKTVTAFNLAVAAALEGRRVLLVDGDVRAQGLTTLTGCAREPGLTSLADHTVLLEDCVQRVRASGAEDLGVVAAGAKLDDPGQFFRNAAFRKAMVAIKEQAELTVIDSPPLLMVADTSAMAGQADGLVLVVSRGTPLGLLEDVRERLDFIGTPVLGYIFNRAVPRNDDYGYHGYGYGYQGRSEGDEGRPGSGLLAGLRSHVGRTGALRRPGQRNEAPYTVDVAQGPTVPSR